MESKCCGDFIHPPPRWGQVGRPGSPGPPTNPAPHGNAGTNGTRPGSRALPIKGWTAGPALTALEGGVSVESKCRGDFIHPPPRRGQVGRLGSPVPPTNPAPHGFSCCFVTDV
jgi:hypothetical protein